MIDKDFLPYEPGFYPVYSNAAGDKCLPAAWGVLAFLGEAPFYYCVIWDFYNGKLELYHEPPRLSYLYGPRMAMAPEEWPT
jgi:hypothetical protein